MSDARNEAEVPPQTIRKLAPGRLVIATHNAGKVREIAALLTPYGMETVSAAELDLPEPEETGTTFVANAELKALAAADLSGLPALADDSKLKVKEGDKFPDVPLSAVQIEKALPDKKDAKTVSVGDLKGKTLVMFFYPKANTGG